ncbi:MAG: PilZ domain-containing protein [Oligoflexales bacterium]
MSLGNLKFKNRRSHLRFDPGPNSIAAIDLSVEPEQHDHDGEKSFSPDFVGLPLSESYKGCSLVIRAHEEITKGKEVRVKIGELSPMTAQIVWVRTLTESVSEIGLHFLE